MAKLTTDYPAHLNIRITAEMRARLDSIDNASAFIRYAIQDKLDTHYPVYLTYEQRQAIQRQANAVLEEALGLINDKEKRRHPAFNTD